MPKPQKNKSNFKNNKNKLISMRIPRDTITKLRELANEKGDLGYQQLIKTYIRDGLSEEEIKYRSKQNGLKKNLTQQATIHQNASASAKNKAVEAVETSPLFQFDPSVDTLKTIKKSIYELTKSKIISEDIQALAESLESYHHCFAGKTFLITGAFGLLGRYIVYLLKYLNDEVLDEKAHGILLDNFVTGYEQRIINDPYLHFFRHDVINPFHSDHSIDYLIHAAGIASPVYYTKYPIETMDVGTTGTRHMLELARTHNILSFLFTSSSEVYGDPDTRHVPTKESYNGNVPILGARSCYDESKRFGETICHTYWKVFDVPVKIVRPFNVYGPGIRPDDYRVLPNFIEHALRREPLPVHGEGKNTRSFCYINDAIEAFFKILFFDANGEAFNVGNPAPEVSVKQLASMVAEFMPHKVDIVHIDPPHAVYASEDPKRRCPDISKLHKATGFNPRYTLENGLARTIQWFRES